MKLSTIDILIILAYLCIIIVIGFIMKKKAEKEQRGLFTRRQ